jgi:hypothetical protein
MDGLIGWQTDRHTDGRTTSHMNGITDR